MNILLQKVQNRILKEIYQIPLVKHQADIDYHIAVDKHKHNLPTISRSDLELVEKIKNEGVVVTTLDDLGILSSTQLLNSAKKLASTMIADVNGDRHQFVIHANCQQMMKYPEIFLWGLEERLLNITEHYIGLPIAYHGAYFRRDIANQLEVGSRLWHIDSEDRKILKIIVYINDVGEKQGPFQYISPALNLDIVQSLNYTYGYIRNKTMEKIISPTNYKSCIGNSGTVVFAGTGSIFHRGKPPEISDRFTIFFDYTSRRAKELFYINRPLPQQNLLKLSQNLSEQQQQSLFWQKYLV